LRVCRTLDPVEMAEFWLVNHATEGDRTFSEAMQAYLLEMQRAGRDEANQKQILRALERFSAQYGENPLRDITSQDISEFIHLSIFDPLGISHWQERLLRRNFSNYSSLCAFN
jgi:hypothetical protein